MRLQSEPVSLSVGGNHLQVPNSLRLIHIQQSILSSTPQLEASCLQTPQMLTIPHTLQEVAGVLLYTLSQRLSDLSYPYQPFTGG